MRTVCRTCTTRRRETFGRSAKHRGPSQHSVRGEEPWFRIAVQRRKLSRNYVRLHVSNALTSSKSPRGGREVYRPALVFQIAASGCIHLLAIPRASIECFQGAAYSSRYRVSECMFCGIRTTLPQMVSLAAIHLRSGSDAHLVFRGRVASMPPRLHRQPSRTLLW